MTHSMQGLFHIPNSPSYFHLASSITISHGVCIHTGPRQNSWEADMEKLTCEQVTEIVVDLLDELLIFFQGFPLVEEQKIDLQASARSQCFSLRFEAVLKDS
jgi:hypothetical protein